MIYRQSVCSMVQKTTSYLPGVEYFTLSGAAPIPSGLAHREAMITCMHITTFVPPRVRY